LLLLCFIEGKNNENPSQNNDIGHKHMMEQNRSCCLRCSYTCTVTKVSANCHTQMLSFPSRHCARRIDALGGAGWSYSDTSSSLADASLWQAFLHFPPCGCWPRSCGAPTEPKALGAGRGWADAPGNSE